MFRQLLLWFFMLLAMRINVGSLAVFLVLLLLVRLLMILLMIIFMIFLRVFVFLVLLFWLLYLLLWLFMCRFILFVIFLFQLFLRLLMSYWNFFLDCLYFFFRFLMYIWLFNFLFWCLVSMINILSRSCFLLTLMGCHGNFLILLRMISLSSCHNLNWSRCVFLEILLRISFLNHLLFCLLLLEFFFLPQPLFF